VITTADRDRYATGYQHFWDDQVYPRQGRLAPAPNMVTSDTDVCIASTSGDMANYLRMLLNRGQGPKGRIVSEEGFTLFSTPYIKAEEFSPTSSYGYGVAVDTLDGHKILRHTGGMVAYASSMHVDLDGGVAAFASINAMQGYRPIAVTEYAVRLLRAAAKSKSLPAAPAIANPDEVDNAADFAGTFTAPDGRMLVFAADAKRLSLLDNGQIIPLEHRRAGTFVSTVPGKFADFPFEFSRSHQDADPVSPNNPVVEVIYGPYWLTNGAYTGPKSFPVLPEFAAFTGHYRSDSSWGGDARVFVLKGQLTLSGDPLTLIGGNLFRAGDEAWSPETAEFHHIAGGKARLLKTGGLDFWRIEVD
jgi:hypothetical protein